jgi:hypothetical protein
MRELAVFKASENIVESSKVSDLIILPRFWEPIQPRKIAFQTVFAMRHEKNK